MVRPSAVTKVPPIRVSGTVNILRPLHIIYVAELSTKNVILSVSQEKALSPDLALAAKYLICNLGKGLCRFQRCLSSLTNIFEKVYAQICLNQRMIRPHING